MRDIAVRTPNEVLLLVPRVVLLLVLVLILHPTDSSTYGVRMIRVCSLHEIIRLREGGWVVRRWAFILVWTKHVRHRVGCGGRCVVTRCWHLLGWHGLVIVIASSHILHRRGRWGIAQSGKHHLVRPVALARDRAKGELSGILVREIPPTVRMVCESRVWEMCLLRRWIVSIARGVIVLRVSGASGVV
jgi:hypothetical protein